MIEAVVDFPLQLSKAADYGDDNQFNFLHLQRQWLSPAEGKKGREMVN